MKIENPPHLGSEDPVGRESVLHMARLAAPAQVWEVGGTAQQNRPLARNFLLQIKFKTLMDQYRIYQRE